MFYIVETKDQLKELLSYREQKTFIEVIPSNDEYHPSLTKPVALYIRPEEKDKGYIIPINHPDGLNIENEIVEKVLTRFDNLYVWDKKELLYHFILPSAKDIQLLYVLNKNKRLDSRFELGKISSFYSKFTIKGDINKVIPITLLYERAEERYDKIKNYLKLKKDESFEFYNNLALKVFFMFEQYGIGVDKENFIKFFSPKQPVYNIQEDTAFTYYNLYNITSRPTNSFNSVNFSAIPHKEDYRKCFKPKNDKFVEFDFDGYHIRILADQLGYNLTDESAHKQLARLYLGKDVLTEQEYINAKKTNFHALYGQIPESYKDIEFFKLIQEYIDKLWEEFNDKGEIKCPISKRVYKINMDSMNAPKLMNYVMQNLETSYNVLIFKNLLYYLRDKKTSIALYTYDSIVLDFSNEDGDNAIGEIKHILEYNNKFPVKVKEALNLNFN